MFDVIPRFIGWLINFNFETMKRLIFGGVIVVLLFVPLAVQFRAYSWHFIWTRYLWIGMAIASSIALFPVIGGNIDKSGGNALLTLLAMTYLLLGALGARKLITQEPPDTSLEDQAAAAGWPAAYVFTNMAGVLRQPTLDRIIHEPNDRFLEKLELEIEQLKAQGYKESSSGNQITLRRGKDLVEFRLSDIAIPTSAEDLAETAVEGAPAPPTLIRPAQGG